MALKNVMLFAIKLDILEVYKAASNIFFLNFCAKIKVDSYDPLPMERILTLLNVIMHIKSVLNKDQNYYY